MNFFNLTIVSAITLSVLVISWFLLKILELVCKRTKTGLDESFIRHFKTPVVLFITILALRTTLPFAIISDKIAAFSVHIFALVIIGIVSWMIIRLFNFLEELIIRRFDINARDNLKARKIHTQFKVLKRILTSVVIVICVAAMLMTFDKVRQFGTAILASAGIVGVVAGLAAQRSLGTIIAGLQIAFTQPIRVDDVVIVENEWGRIEEITLTYVVVRIWDLRRLIIPITYFIEKPFQNWTRVTADILGTIYIYVDYTFPVEKMRAELKLIAEQSPNWDGKVCGLQVTNTTEKTIELRALVSASDASKAWDLRCFVREKLIEFVQNYYPNTLPKFRAELEKD